MSNRRRIATVTGPEFHRRANQLLESGAWKDLPFITVDQINEHNDWKLRTSYDLSDPMIMERQGQYYVVATREAYEQA